MIKILSKIKNYVILIENNYTLKEKKIWKK